MELLVPPPPLMAVLFLLVEMESEALKIGILDENNTSMAMGNMWQRRDRGRL